MNGKFLFNATITMTAKKGVTRARLTKVCDRLLLREIQELCTIDGDFTTISENFISNRVVEYYIESENPDTAKEIYWKLMDLVKLLAFEKESSYGELEDYSVEQKTSF